MDELVDLILETIETGMSVGYTNKEGMLSIRYDLENRRYHYYEAGDMIDERRFDSADPEELRDLLKKRGFSGVDESLRTYLCFTGYQALLAGDRGKARSCFERALQYGWVIAHVGLALLENDREDLDKARSHLETLTAAEATKAWAYGLSGARYVFAEATVEGIYKSPRYERMHDLFDKLLSIEPGRADLLFGRGFAHEMLQDWHDAIDDYGRSLDGDCPRLSRNRARFGLIRCLVCAGRVEDAQKAFDDSPAEELSKISSEALRKILADIEVALAWC